MDNSTKCTKQKNCAWKNIQTISFIDYTLQSVCLIICHALYNIYNFRNDSLNFVLCTKFYLFKRMCTIKHETFTITIVKVKKISTRNLLFKLEKNEEFFPSLF